MVKNMKKGWRHQGLLAATIGFGLTLQAHAGLVNFEYTVEDVNGDGSEYEYDMQFWIDVDDPEYSSTLGFSSINVNVGTADGGVGGPRPFGNNFITEVQSGFTATDVTGLPNSSVIRVDAPGFNFWQPNMDDFFIRFTGVSSVLADMTWNYFGRSDVDVNTSVISGADGRGRLTSPPVMMLTDFSPPPTGGGGAARVPAPPSLPLAIAGIGLVALVRRKLPSSN